MGSDAPLCSLCPFAVACFCLLPDPVNAAEQNRVKQLVLQDEEIGSVNAEATSLIGTFKGNRQNKVYLITLRPF